MIIFVNNKSTKVCQIALYIKTFIHKRKVVPFFLPHGIVIRRAGCKCVEALAGSLLLEALKTEWWGAGVVVCLEQGADNSMTHI